MTAKGRLPTILWTRSLLTTLVVAIILILVQLNQHHILTLAYLQQSQHDIANFYANHPWQTRALFFLLNLTSAALSLPCTLLFCLMGGATFGFTWGLLLVSFASTIGATLAFWSARFVLRDWVRRHIGERLDRINQGVEGKGRWYLFSMRLVPIIPFFVTNLALGLTSMRSWTFYWVTQLGMLGIIAVYVNAGRQLSHMQALTDAADPAVLAPFAVLALLPVLVHWNDQRRNRDATRP